MSMSSTDEDPGAVLRIEPVAARQSTERVYSSEQAQRGQTAYLQNCSACHQTDLSGLAQAPALKGDAFLAMWGKLGDLVDRTRTTMPPTAPGSLSPNTYLDIDAYILQMNGLPAGAQELDGASPSLQEPVGK